MTATRGLSIWCNARLSTDAMEFLHNCLSHHDLKIGSPLLTTNGGGGGGITNDPGLSLDDADIAFGQPDPAQIIRSPRVRWVQLTNAASGAHGREDVIQALRERNGVLTTSASIFREPCAQHILAMMLSVARRLPQAWLEQQKSRAWPSQTERLCCALLGGQTVMLYGYGSIANRVAELLHPFGDVHIIGVRRSVAIGNLAANDRVRLIATDEADAVLPQADHVINLLPLSAVTTRYFGESRLDRFKPGAIFYNVGRGATVDHDALLSTLRSGRLGAACLDVTDPQPLPRDHPLWDEANCFITPQTSSGRSDESHALVSHFLDNLSRFCAGTEMIDRVNLTARPPSPQ